MFKYTFSAYKIDCHFIKYPVFALTWDDVITFLEKFRCFDYKITKQSFPDASDSDTILECYFPGATFFINAELFDLSTCEDESEEYAIVKKRIDELFDTDYQKGKTPEETPEEEF